ncbi:hypothetical protein TUM17576_53520 [Enterobacter hormaechei]|nr:hypothetical protein TUM17576_53520 [Enterobacter hormaechei]
MEYKDNDLLGKIYAWDINRNDVKTPIALEYNDFCFLNKDDSWGLLNGKLSNMIITHLMNKILKELTLLSVNNINIFL